MYSDGAHGERFKKRATLNSGYNYVIKTLLLFENEYF